ncbi:hypothetical protein [Gluconobacter cerinus]|nr:hypothetical protein [Gluconobacter cerinus]
MAAEQIGDDTGLSVLLGGVPAARWMLANRDYNADWFRDTQ